MLLLVPVVMYQQQLHDFTWEQVLKLLGTVSKENQSAAFTAIHRTILHLCVTQSLINGRDLTL